MLTVCLIEVLVWEQVLSVSELGRGEVVVRKRSRKGLARH